MINTEIQVKFIIHDELFLNHKEITRVIGSAPSITWNKGDQVRKDLSRNESSWIFSSGYIKTLYLEDVLDILIDKLEPNVLSLSAYLKKYSLESKFDIVLRIAGNQAPSHCLSQRFIHLCSLLNSDIDTDIYLL